MAECYSEDVLLVPHRGDPLPDRFVDLIWNREVMAILVLERFSAQPAVNGKTRLGVKIVPGTC
jgi:hypothetical protein